MLLWARRSTMMGDDGENGNGDLILSRRLFSSALTLPSVGIVSTRSRETLKTIYARPLLKIDERGGVVASSAGVNGSLSDR
jgi:hypothetical protein